MTMHECKGIKPLTSAQYRRFKKCSVCKHEFYTTQVGKGLICNVCVESQVAQ